MSRKPKDPIDASAYKHDDKKRLNNPEAGNIDRMPKAAETRKTYNWDPREAPQLVWSGKAGLKMAEAKEEMSFEVPLVNLHIHERVAPEAILRSARREDAQRSLFADPVMEFSKEIQFYKHQVDWSNRLILGDSLQVMSSLLEREGMRGKVQMIYLDPPYGIKFGSNFQPKIDKRDVKDGADDDLTREVEQVQAFRDTWELEEHTFLSYLRDRLILARELLADSGSIFVQMGEDNVHRVRLLMDEVFDDENFVAQINYRTRMPLASAEIENVYDYLLWYSKDKPSLKYRNVWQSKNTGMDSEFVFADAGDNGGSASDGFRRLEPEEQAAFEQTTKRLNIFKRSDLSSSGYTASCTYPIDFQGASHTNLAGKSWRTTRDGMSRVIAANRLFVLGKKLYYKLYHKDFPLRSLENSWPDTIAYDSRDYVVQTTPTVIQRCMLMTTDPGDIVLDPTCGSGTTAYVAEQWGRRWITCDTSRVAVAIARHRLMTAAFDYYKLRHTTAGVGGGFRYKTVPHITLKSIAQNAEIDAIANEFQPQIDAALATLNKEHVTSYKEWEVPLGVRELVPALHPGDLSPGSAQAPNAQSGDESPHSQRFWSLKREMQKRIDASIQRSAPQEELVDQPEKESGVVRVSGPFTVEAVPNVSELSVEVEEKIWYPGTLAPEGGEGVGGLQMQIFDPVQPSLEAKNVSAYLSDMIEKLRKVGVVTKGKGRLTFSNLRPMDHEIVHAEGDLVIEKPPRPSEGEGVGGEGNTVRCAIIFGPQNGAVSEIVVREGLDATRKYDAVLFCGYDFTAPAQERLRLPAVGQQVFMAYIAPDTAMTDLLKDTKASQIFTMVGEPDVVVYRFGDPSLAPLSADAKQRGADEVAKRLSALAEGEVFLELRGVDLYNPLTGTVSSEGGADVHAIFVDHDYDGKSFCICQALFPNKKDSWEKIERSLKGSLDTDAFDAFRTHVTLPFKPGANGRVQIKVYDTRGNAVVKTVRV